MTKDYVREYVVFCRKCAHWIRSSDCALKTAKQRWKAQGWTHNKKRGWNCLMCSGKEKKDAESAT